MASTKPLVHLVLDQEIIDRIDDFRFTKRFPSRSAAMKWLLTWALEQQQEAKQGAESQATDAGQYEAAA